jgi:hypothetical protein
MPEIIWKQGAENDLLQIFVDLEDRSEEAGVRFVRKLDFTSKIFACIQESLRCSNSRCVALSSVQRGTACFIRSKRGASWCTRLSI